MSDLYIYTLFDTKSNKPRCTGIKDGNNIKICDLYRPGAGKTIQKINKTIKLIQQIILKANSEKRRIIISDFKSHIQAFDLPLDKREYNVYDMHLPEIAPTNSKSKDELVITKVIDKLADTNPSEYNKLLSNSAVVYQYLENNGISVNSIPEYPKWSQKTFSGRSKTTNFNIQGLADNYHVVPMGGEDCDVMIIFDWICADIRAASIMSGDQLLNEAFEKSDPYTILMNELNSGSEDQITREESKRYLLKSINSMDFTSTALMDIYPQLGQWIGRCKGLIKEGKPLQTLLDRKFRLARAKNQLAVLNGAIQGSVAHAMQLSLRRIWEKLPDRIICEIHDCLIVSSSPEPSHIKATIDIVVPIMFKPFEGILTDNPSFPLNVSIGTKWKKWKLYKSLRDKQ
jgi:hypothetical protein